MPVAKNKTKKYVLFWKQPANLIHLRIKMSFKMSQEAGRFHLNIINNIDDNLISIKQIILSFTEKNEFEIYTTHTLITTATYVHISYMLTFYFADELDINQ